MKYANPFDFKRQQFDAYDMFHTVQYGSPFVRFANGMLSCRDASPKPDMRGHYPDYNLSICATNDDNCPTFYHEGKPIPKAWLNQDGQQYFVLDECTGKAWRLHYDWSDSGYKGRVPECVDSHGLVFMNEGYDPIIRKHFELSSPDPKLAKHVRHISTQIQEPLMAMSKLSVNHYTFGRYEAMTPFVFNPEWVGLSLEKLIGQIAESQPHMIQSLAKKGFAIPRVITKRPYLTTNKEES